ncbi:patatin [Exilibacterium tricleocarpae]|uniref:Patatin n=1 Tax=Exilibacterium tricleocarpae TaxID=2591008 RepID=A0A545TUV8_9GAMM|nr:patatin-like phospholipase family protein [Exilibacterium tricleocarpae]TQV81013.1 patatin [Exilibacterium tricleocarpae]
MSDRDQDGDKETDTTESAPPILPRQTTRDKKIALALGSGSARGWGHIGVIRALHDAGIAPDIVCGSSIGALVGASYANGRLADLETWARSLTTWKMVRFVDVRITTAAMIDGGRLRMELSEVIADQDTLIEDLPIRFGAVATKLLSGREIQFTQGSLQEAIWSSAAIPGILPPVRLDDEWLVDGGVVNPVPVSLCRTLDADLVIAVNLNGNIIGARGGDAKKRSARPARKHSGGKDGREDSFSKFKESIIRHPLYPFPLEEPEDIKAGVKPPGMFEAFADAINIMQDRITRSRMVGDPPDVLIAPHMAGIWMMDFTRAAEAIDIGYASVERLLPEILHQIKMAK